MTCILYIIIHSYKGKGLTHAWEMFKYDIPRLYRIVNEKRKRKCKVIMIIYTIDIIPGMIYTFPRHYRYKCNFFLYSGLRRTHKHDSLSKYRSAAVIGYHPPLPSTISADGWACTFMIQIIRNHSYTLKTLMITCSAKLIGEQTFH